MTLRNNIVPPLALTMGDPGGVSAEITVAAWRALRTQGPVFFVVGDAALLKNSGASIVEIGAPSDAAACFPKTLPVLPVENPIDAAPGVSSPQNAEAVLESIRRAVLFAVDGAAAGVVTNPIQKASLIASGFAFPGHTEFLADLTKHAPTPAGRIRGAVMMLAGPALKTVPVTIHQSVLNAVKSLSTERIVKTATIAAQALTSEFEIPKPRLAISGLNPHAGEKGVLGREEDEIIAPAVRMLRDNGVSASGPLPADAMFHADARANYDAAICMLHDQALIPVKTLAFHEAVNVTLGLPIVRTSPDHGVALGIAGKGQARPDSLIAAIKLAADIAARRRAAGP